MNLLELKENIDDLIKQCNYWHEDVRKVPVLINLTQSSIGARASVGIKNICEGFDWEAGEIRIEPNRAICDKTVFDIDKNVGYNPIIHPTINGKSNYFCYKCRTRISKKDNYCKNCGCKINKKDLSNIKTSEVLILIRFLENIKINNIWLDKRDFIKNINIAFGNTLKHLFIKLNGDNKFNELNAYNKLFDYLELPYTLTCKVIDVKGTIKAEKWIIE